MSIKYNNKFLLLLVVVYSIGALAWSNIGLPDRFGMSSVVPYLIIIAIGCIYCKKDGTFYTEFVPYNVGIKPLTAVLAVVITMVLYPFCGVLSEVGSLLGPNVLQVFENTMQDKSLFENIISTAVVPAVFEEFFFRGAIYGGIKRARGARSAIIWTSILFGMFHMNIQQFLYAAVLGVVFGIFREITGSMWTGMLCHFVNNALAVVDSAYPENIHSKTLANVDIFGSTGQVALALVMSAVGIVIAVILVRLLAKTEGKAAELGSFFKEDKGEGTKLCDVRFILAIVVILLMTALVAFSLSLMASMPAQ